jgi:hypothetical protein
MHRLCAGVLPGMPSSGVPEVRGQANLNWRIPVRDDRHARRRSGQGASPNTSIIKLAHCQRMVMARLLRNL